MFEKKLRPNYYTSTYGQEFSQISTIILIVIGLITTSYFWNRDLEIVLKATEYFVNPKFAEFMNRSIFNFNGDGFGGQDISYFLFFTCVLIYLWANKFGNEERYKLTRIRSGFIIVSSVALFTMNRVIAIFFARVNPEEAMVNTYLYSSMLTFGKYSLWDALMKGCFTSGHTTLAVLLVSLAFITLSSSTLWRIILNFTVFLSWPIIMGITRVITARNYPTDVIWGFITGLLLINWIYFKLLRVHEQEREIFKIYGRYAEIRWAFSFFLYGIWIATTLIGIKFAIINFQWYSPVIIILAILLIGLTSNNLNHIIYGPVIIDE